MQDLSVDCFDQSICDYFATLTCISLDNIETLNINGFRCDGNKLVAKLISSIFSEDKFKQIAFTECDELSGETYMLLAGCCSLKNCTFNTVNMSQTVFDDIVKSNPGIEWLDLTACWNITNLTAISEHCQNLMTLTVVSEFNDFKVGLILNNCLRLTELKLQSCEQDTIFDLSELHISSLALTTLLILNCNGRFEILFESSKLLTTLTLEIAISDVLLRTVAANCSLLKYLRLISRSNNTKCGLDSVLQLLKSCNKLHTLEINQSFAVAENNSAVFLTIYRAIAPLLCHLKELNIAADWSKAECYLSDPVLDCIGEHCISLERLQLPVTTELVTLDAVKRLLTALLPL